MERTSVPEAAVHEHREMLPAEHQVSFAAHAVERSHIDRVAEAKSVDGGSQRQFGRGIPSSAALHRSPYRQGRRPGFGAMFARARIGVGPVRR